MADIAASVLARLKNKAKESGRSYQLCLQLFCQEEFLRRLEKSQYAENLVLKGGLFIYSVTDFDSRVTVDVDFLLRKVPNTPEQLQTVIETIISTPTGNDFVTFEIKDIAPIAVAKKYAGIGVSLVARIKNTKTPFSIDFGVGDVIVPKQEKRKIPTQLEDFTEPTVNTYRELVLTLPDKANADGWDDAAYFAAKVKKLNESEELKRLGLHFSAIIPYSTSKAGSPDTKLDNLAVGVVQDYMIEAEKRMVAELVKDKRLGQDAYLLKDGSLEYKVMKSGREDLRTLQKIKHNYSWVIGVSKSFNPESCLDHTGKPNSNYIADLPVYHRTPVARYENRDFLGDVQFGVWYIRLRDKRRTQTPFDGVVKVEKIMMDEEIDNGIDSDVIDLLSANIINERNPTCYGTDRRWANHLYPVFLTESYVKSKYISTEMFLHLF